LVAPRLILDEDRVVGFVMGNFDPDNEISAFRAGIWRLNIAADEQGQGYGRFAVEGFRPTGQVMTDGAGRDEVVGELTL
jgi:hypothetical protein